MEKELTYAEMLKNMGHGVDDNEAIEGEFVDAPAEQVEEKQPASKNERIRIPVAIGIAALVAAPVILLVATTGGNMGQSAKNSSATATATNAPDDAKKKAEEELEKAKTDLFLQTQIDKEKAAAQPSASPSVSPSAAPSVAVKPTPSTSPKQVTASDEGKASEQKIAKLEAQIARLEQSLAQKSKVAQPARVQAVARSAPISTPRQQTQIARAIAQPSPAPLPSARSTPSPTPKAQAPQIAKAAASPSAEKKASWDEIASAGSYGGREEPKASSSKSMEQPEPTVGSMRLPVGVSVAGRTAGPIAMLVGSSQNIRQEKDGQVLSVATEQPIQVTGGWSIPAGSVIEFAIATNESGLIQGTSKKVFIGNEEVKIPAGAFGLSTPAGEPLMASVSQPNGSQIADADTKGAVWGGLTEVGKALSRAGDTNITSNSGLGSTVTTVNNPNPNILGAGASGVFGVLSKRNTDRAEALNKRAEKQGYIATLPANTKVQVFVLQAAAFSPPSTGYAEAPPPAPPTAAETDPDLLEAVSRKRKQMAASTLVPINEQKPQPELPKSLRGID